ncbi:hypothetical protein ABBQ32_006348 [Trebouxia sp. C0010 RCD-2024]
MCIKDIGGRGQRAATLPKCVLPLDHVTRCVVRHFQGQSTWLKPNADAIKRQLKDELGIDYTTAKLAGKIQRKCFIFPSIEGCIYKMKKKGWMTDEEASMDDVPY